MIIIIANEQHNILKEKMEILENNKKILVAAYKNKIKEDNKYQLKKELNKVVESLQMVSIMMFTLFALLKFTSVIQSTLNYTHNEAFIVSSLSVSTIFLLSTVLYDTIRREYTNNPIKFINGIKNFLYINSIKFIIVVGTFTTCDIFYKVII